MKRFAEDKPMDMNASKVSTSGSGKACALKPRAVQSTARST